MIGIGQSLHEAVQGGNCAAATAERDFLDCVDQQSRTIEKMQTDDNGSATSGC